MSGKGETLLPFCAAGTNGIQKKEPADCALPVFSVCREGVPGERLLDFFGDLYYNMITAAKRSFPFFS